jgi:pyruvate dehydrogenase E2 component (dihydrolipoamide acetyltransferase)
MPRLSDSMEEGTVAKWLVEVGATVERGQAVVEIDTDKATMEYEAEVAGTLLATVVPEGEDAPIGAVIAWIGEPGEEVPADDAAARPSAPAPAQPAAPAAARAEPSTSAGREDRVNASPVARRLARELGVDLATVTGTGRGGMISREDVEAASARGAAPAGHPPSAAKGEVRLQELTRLQQTIARRMVDGASAPDFAVEMDVDMTRCVELRAELGRGEAAAPTLNDIVVRAVALALRDFPRMNGSYTERGLELYARINVGVAVATEDGLVVPTVVDADAKSLDEIAATTRELAAKVRDRTITPAELEGGTFTVSNLGMLGVRRFFPILNPPQAGILGVGEVARRAVVDESGDVTTPHLMSLCLVCDHRIVYGADAARFLARVRELLEQPDALAA